MPMTVIVYDKNIYCLSINLIKMVIMSFLQASTLQMAILLMYNSSDQYTIQNLIDTLDIKQETLIQVITQNFLSTEKVFIRNMNNR